jgi:arylsulfatase A-like enzyme
MPAAHDDGRPNVLLLHSHDLGRHLGCYGRDVRTPNIDRIADHGVTLENHFCPAPQCCPSRGSLHTGRYPHVNGLLGQITWGWDLPSEETTLADELSAAGYATHVFGVQHVRQDSTTLYDEVHCERERAATLADIVVGDLPAMADEGPFFASVGFFEPHLDVGDDPPYTFAYPDLDDALFDEYDPDAVTVPPYLPDTQRVRESIANLNGLVTNTLDPAVGRICDRLAELGLAEDTLVVFTTDHGLPLPRAKGACYDPGLETAFLLRWPGVLDGGERYDALTSHVDVLPTLLDLLGLPIPADRCGRSFEGLLTGGDYTPRDHVFAEMTWHERYAPMRAIRTTDAKYVRNVWKQQRVHLPADIFGSRAGRAVREAFYIDERPREELYDLTADPNEQASLAPGRGVFAPQREEAPSSEDERLPSLRRQVYDWMESTDDPLLDGPVTRPGTGTWRGEP